MFQYFVHDCLCTKAFVCCLSQSPSNFKNLILFINSNPFSNFNTDIKYDSWWCFLEQNIFLSEKQEYFSCTTNLYSNYREQIFRQPWIKHFETFQHLSNINSPQVKRHDISSITNVVYELSQELPNEIMKYWIKIGWRQSLVPNLISRNNFITRVKNSAEACVKVFCSCSILLDFFTLFEIFLP